MTYNYIFPIGIKDFYIKLIWFVYNNRYILIYSYRAIMRKAFT